MRTRLRLPIPLLLVAALAGFSGCVWPKAPPTPAESRPTVSSVSSMPAPEKPKSPPVSPAPVPVPAPMPTPTPAPPAPASLPKSYESGTAALQEGKYERALELFCAALKEKPGNPEISKGFDEALAGLKKQGYEAYNQGKPETAGKRWMGTLRFIDHPAAKGKGYPSTRVEVQAQVDRLTVEQMEKGLLNYRKGDIPAAIAAWKTILAYDPGNEEAARAVRTASIQLENLKKIPSVQ